MYAVALGGAGCSSSAGVGMSSSYDKTARVWPLAGGKGRSLATLNHPDWVGSVSALAETPNRTQLTNEAN